jgi:hypothetical protein
MLMADLVFTFGIGIVASIVSGIAGGGGGMLVAPLFILLGWPAQVAIATAKVGGVGVTIGSLLKFRGTGYIQKKYVLPLAALAMIAGVIGSYLLLYISEEVATKLVGLMMLAALPFFFLKKDIGLVRASTTPLKVGVGYTLFFIVLVLQAAFSGGIGMLLPLIMASLFGLTMLESAATRRVAGLIGAATGISIFALNDVIAYDHGIALFFGTVIGGWIGTHIAIKKGNGFVKGALSVVLVLMSAQLLFG